MKSMTCAAILLLGITLTHAADAPLTLDSLKGIYEKAQASIDADCAKQKTDALEAYGKALDAYLAQFKQQGKLNDYLAIETEKKRFVAQKTIPSAETRSGEYVALAAKNYEDGVAKADADRQAKTADLIGKYTSRLDGLIKDLMKADKIADAKAVQDEKQRVEFILATIPAAAPVVKPDAAPAQTASVGVTSLLLSTKDAAADKGYKLLGSWPTDRTGGMSTDGQQTPGNLYLFIQKGLSEQPITDVILYNAQAGNSPRIGTPKGYESLGHWDVQSSVDAFGTANEWNVSLCVKKEKGKKPVLDVLLDASAQQNGYMNKGSFNGLTLWVKYEAFGKDSGAQRQAGEQAVAPAVVKPDVAEKSPSNDGKRIKKLVPGNATEFQGHHYLFIELKKASTVHRLGEAKKAIGIPTWTDAQAECEKMGGHLAILNDAKTFEFARTLAELEKKNRVWIGLRRLEDGGAFKWTDGTDVRYAGWCPWQPANGPGMRYVSMGVGWEFKTGWNVEFDSAAVTGYICEWDY